MNSRTSLSRLSIAAIVFGLLTVLGISVTLFGQEEGVGAGWASARRLPLPMDWSTRHVIYSGTFKGGSPNASAEDKLAKSKYDPRLLHSWILQGHMLKGKSRRGLSLSERLSSSPSALARTTTSKSKKPPTPAPTPNPPKLTSKVPRDWSLSLGSGGVAQNMFPAKFSFDINADPDCFNDYVVFGLNVAGSATQANLVGVNNLYSGAGPGICGLNPTIKFAYNVSTLSGGRVTTSPILNQDGSVIVFVESNGTASVLHVLKWKDATGTASVTSGVITPTTTAGPINNCLAPCMFNLTFGTSGTTVSSPFYDYQVDDALYVGNDNGKLFQITGVMSGIPTVSTTGGWSAAGVTVGGAGVKLTGPVLNYDPASPYLFIGGSDGKLYAVLSTSPATQVSLAIGSGTANGGGIVDAPTVDGFAGEVYAWSAANAAGTGNTLANKTAVTVQSALTPPLTSAKTATIGQGTLGTTAGLNTVAGAFDNDYYNWSGSGVNIGHLYIMGTAAANTSPTLYQLPFSGIGSVTVTGNGGGYTTPVVNITGNGAQATATASGGVDSATLTSQGSGYTTIPTAAFAAAPAGGTTATGAAVSVGVNTIAVSNGGSGYTAVPSVTINGTNTSAASATAALGVNSVAVSDGSTYTALPSVSFPGGTTNATGSPLLGLLSIGVTAGGAFTTLPTMTITPSGGGGTATPTVGVTAVGVTAGGSGFSSVPAVAFAGTGAPNATATAALGVNTLTLNTAGIGYTSVPSVSVPSGGGTDATATATLGVKSLTLTAGGAGYTAFPTVGFSGGGGTGATATATVGISTVAVNAATTTGTMTFTSSRPASGGTTTVGGITYVYQQTCGSTAFCVTTSNSSGTTNATNFRNALQGNCGGAACAANGSVTASSSGSVVTITNITAGSIVFTDNSTNTTQSPTGGAISNNGSAGCTNGTQNLVFAGAGGSGAAGTATVASGVVTAVSLTTGGSGYTAFPTFTVNNCSTQPTNRAITATITGLNLTASGNNFTSVPGVTFAGAGGSGSTATAALGVQTVTLNSAGTGYTAVPTVTIAGGTTNATATANLKVVSVAVNTPGSYTTPFPAASIAGTTLTTTVTIQSVAVVNPGSYPSYPSVSAGGGSTLTVPSAKVVGVTVATPGTGYTAGPIVPIFSPAGAAATADLKVVTVTPTAAGSYTTFPTATVDSGFGGSGTVLTVSAKVVGLAAPTTPGSGYTTAPAITFTGGGGTGAAGTSTINVTAVSVTYGGGGYSTATVSFTGSGNAAAATANINPGNVMTPGTSPSNFSIDTTAGLISSPLTEIFNGTQDLMFYSFGSTSTVGVVVAQDITNGVYGNIVAGYNPPPPATSGIVVDNISTSAQAASIYFTTLASSIIGSQLQADAISVAKTSGGIFTTNTVTITTTNPHGFTTGESITIAGVTCNNGGACSEAINGTYTITVASATTFTYSLGSCLCLNLTSDSNKGTATGIVNISAFSAIKLTQQGLQ